MRGLFVLAAINFAPTLTVLGQLWSEPLRE